MKLLLVIGITIIIAGCSAVYSPVPIGENPTNIEETHDEWEGTWMTSDGDSLTVKVIDGSNGVLQVGWIEDEQDGLRMETASVHLRDAGDWTIANFKSQSETNEERFVWARIKKEKKQAIFWSPDVETFQSLIQEEKIPGILDGSNVVLGNLTSNDWKVIMSEKNNALLDWEEPFLLIKSGE